LNRFDREQTSEGLPASLGTVTDELKSTVERQLRQIVEAAESRAAAIEDAALRKAAETEREAAVRAEDLFKTGSDRAEAMLETIDLLESEIGVVMSALRAEAQSLKSELDDRRSMAATAAPDSVSDQAPAAPTAQTSAPAEPEQPSAAPDPAPPPSTPSADTAPQATTVTTAAPIAELAQTDAPLEPTASEGAQRTETQAEPLAAPAQPDPATDGAPAPDERETIRAQIVAMLHSGKPRAEAEAALMRLKQGSHYIDLLDEVYSLNQSNYPPQSRRRGLFRRL
jgi:hypothetical protein